VPYSVVATLAALWLHSRWIVADRRWRLTSRVCGGRCAKQAACANTLQTPILGCASLLVFGSCIAGQLVFLPACSGFFRRSSETEPMS
jgi:hypothetical protein